MRVTVVEFLPRIVPIADFEIGGSCNGVWSSKVWNSTSKPRSSAEKFKACATVVAETKDGKSLSLDCDRVLVAVGRKPYTEGLGLAELGVKIDVKSGRVEVDRDFRTNLPSVRAIGDLIAGPMLAHKAEDEGVACAELIAGKPGHVNYETIPSVIYTWPEMASVGLSEEQCKERGLDYRVGKFPFMANGRAKAMDETEGLVKVIADAKTDRLLGVHIIGPRVPT